MAATMTLDFSTPHVLRSVREYNAAVAEVDRLLDANPKKGGGVHGRTEPRVGFLQGRAAAVDKSDQGAS